MLLFFRLIKIHFSVWHIYSGFDGDGCVRVQFKDMQMQIESAELISDYDTLDDGRQINYLL